MGGAGNSAVGGASLSPSASAAAVAGPSLATASGGSIPGNTFAPFTVVLFIQTTEEMVFPGLISLTISH